MDFKIAFVLFLGVFALTVEDGVHAWRVRVRRVVSAVCKPFCPKVCKWVTRGAVRTRVCSVVCKKVCGRKRRDAQGDGAFYEPLPNDFQLYDINGDGSITFEEFATVLNEKDNGVAEAYMYADVNLDTKLTKEEFKNGPFLLKEDVDGGSEINGGQPVTTTLAV